MFAELDENTVGRSTNISSTKKQSICSHTATTLNETEFQRTSVSLSSNHYRLPFLFELNRKHI